METGLAPLCRDILANYGEIVHASYADSLAGAESLEAALQAFVSDPTETTLATAKQAWIDAREPYLQTEAYRFYAGPIDDPDGPEPMINGWPMDESYIDYTVGAPDAGIINEPDLHPIIDKDLVARLNERAGETAISCGFHAIEFLLWGQDLSDDGPGARPLTDYTTARQADRRGAYLLACADLLTDHLAGLVADWAPDDEDNFRATFGKDDPLTAVRAVLYGVHTMTGKELAGERLLVAWDTQDQEDEHSCFSDTTHLDHRRDAQGIANVYGGTYRRTDGTSIAGPGLRVLVRTQMPERLEEFDGQMQTVLETIGQIPTPFDQAIIGEDDAPGRVAVLDAVVALEDFAALLAELDRVLR